jgi:hypothetical protein
VVHGRVGDDAVDDAVADGDGDDVLMTGMTVVMMC